MPTRMRAAVLYEINKPLVIEEVDLDDPAPNEVLIEVRASGVCHSDLHYMDGSQPRPMPTIPGHEAAGVVTAVGQEVTSVRVGDHVIPLFCPECGVCDNCTSGKTNICKKFGALNAKTRISRGDQRFHRTSLGTFATHALVPDYAVAKVREDARFDRIFYCGCGVTTGVGAVMFDARVQPGEKVVVFGVGGIGLNVVQGARLAGASMIVAVDFNPAREADAMAFGATHFVNPRVAEGDLVSKLLDLTGGGADHSFECIGNVNAMRQAVEATNLYWGRCTILGIAAHDQQLQLDPVGMILGRSIKGSVFGGARGRSDVPKVVDWYMDGALNIDGLVTHTLPFDQINEGFDLLRRGESIRTVLTF